MTETEQIHSTLKFVLQSLPIALKSQLTHLSDPVRVKKSTKGLDILKMPIYPKRLDGFWSAEWCSYEIGVGLYGKPTTGGIGFFCFPNNKDCGKNYYTLEVESILRNLEQIRPKEFEFSVGKASVSLNRFYLATKFPSFPCAQAARDLAWLIEQSFPEFEKMTTGTASN